MGYDKTRPKIPLNNWKFHDSKLIVESNFKFNYLNLDVSVNKRVYTRAIVCVFDVYTHIYATSAICTF